VARSNAATVSEYLHALPDDRRAVVSAVRDVILEHLPAGYQESMSWGAISYEVPLSRYPKTYNGQPLSYAALAAQKNYYALYLMGAYVGDGEPARLLKDGFAKAGKKLDMGKSCVRFKTLDDLPLDVIGRVVASTPPDAFIREYEKVKRS